jgi:hypothetical protein
MRGGNLVESEILVSSASESNPRATMLALSISPHTSNTLAHRLAPGLAPLARPARSCLRPRPRCGARAATLRELGSVQAPTWARWPPWYRAFRGYAASR